LKREDGSQTRLLIAYFSGTGNTAYVAAYLKQALGRLPLTTDLDAIERRQPARARTFDILAIGFPVYGCAPPSLVLDYIDLLPDGNGRGTFVFCTKAFFAGGAPQLALRRLVRRGYVPLGVVTVQMPGSDALAFSRKGSKRTMAAANRDYSQISEIDRFIAMGAEAIAAIAAGNSAGPYRIHHFPNVVASVLTGFCIAMMPLIMGFLRRRLRADGRCISCGLCERICPVGNIRVQHGRPRFNQHCILCLRCLHNCPREAIQIGRATVDKTRWRGPSGSFHPPEGLQGGTAQAEMIGGKKAQ